jgi:hypothetical protein
MSGTPPFCTIGHNYYTTTFSDATGWSLNANCAVTGGQLIRSGGPSEGIATFTQSMNVADISTVYISSNISHNVTSFNVYAKIALGTLGEVTFVMYKDGSVSLNATNGSTATSSSYYCVITSNAAQTIWYATVNGTYIGSCTIAAPSNTLLNGMTLIPNYYLFGVSEKISFDDITITSHALTAPACQGLIPTYHKEIDSSTAKISHSRIIREDRNAIQATQFHNQMKATT